MISIFVLIIDLYYFFQISFHDLNFASIAIYFLFYLFSMQVFNPTSSPVPSVPVQRVIILEEDLEISSDFFEFFAALSPMIDTDDSLLGTYVLTACTVRYHSTHFIIVFYYFVLSIYIFLFCFVLFCFVLFCFVLFCFVYFVFISLC